MRGRGRALLIALALCAAAPASTLAQGFGDASPPGANDFACKPTPAHPNPVVLVHGLGATMQANWYWMAPRIADAGYCVFALTYGKKSDNPPPFNENGGLIRAEESAKELAAFIDRVLAATGAQKVDIVGHSEGSLMPNYYLKFMPEARHLGGPLDGQPKVDRYVGMTPLWDGTDVGMLGTISEQGESTGGPAIGRELVSTGCEFCPQALKGSEFIQKMNSGGGPRVPGVTYTMIMTTYDELVVPHTSGIMEGATNLVLQEQCAADPSDHMAPATNPNALLDIFNALDPAHAKPVDCTTLMDFGG